MLTAQLHNMYTHRLWLHEAVPSSRGQTGRLDKGQCHVLGDLSPNPSCATDLLHNFRQAHSATI